MRSVWMLFPLILGASMGHADVTTSGNVRLDPGDWRIGHTANGSLLVDGGSSLSLTTGLTPSSNAILWLGNSPGATGTGIVDGGSISLDNGNGAYVRVGGYGTGFLTLRNGSSLSLSSVLPNGSSNGADIAVGSNSPTGTGSLVVDNSSVSVTGSGASLVTGRSGGTGSVVIKNSSVVTLTSTGNVRSDPWTFLWAGNSLNGNGFVTVDNSVVQIDGAGTGAALTAGHHSGASGYITVSGSTARVDIKSGVESLVQAGADAGTLGHVTITDGARINLDSPLSSVIVGYRSGSVGTLNVSAGAKILTSASPASYMMIGGAFPTSDPDIPSHMAAGKGTVNVVGSGSEIAVNNTVWIGAPISLGGISDGGLLNVSNGGLVRADTVLVGSNGVLSGDGTVIANVFLDGGILDPGNSPGTLTIDGNLGILGGGLIRIELDGADPSAQDHIAVSGFADLTGATLLLDFSDYKPQLGDTFDFLTAGAGLVLENVILRAMGLGHGLGMSLGFGSERNGLFVNIIEAQEVPEPSSWLLIALGLGLVVCVQRKRVGDGLASLRRTQALSAA